MLQVIVSYNLRNGKEEESHAFLANKLAPGLSKLGFEFEDIYLSIWGNAPHIRAVGMVEGPTEAEAIFLSEKWKKLEEEMAALTRDFTLRFEKWQGASQN